MFKFAWALVFFALSIFASDPPPSDASAEELAKDPWIRETAQQAYTEAWAARADGKFIDKYFLHLHKMMSEYNDLTPAYFEKLARSEGWEVYLIARGKPPSGSAPVYLSKQRKDRPRFWLWVETRGKVAALNLLKEIGKTPENNLKDLENTGLLTRNKK